MRCVIRPIKGNENKFTQLKSIAAEFGRIAVVSDKGRFIAIEDVKDRAALTTSIEAAGGSVSDDFKYTPSV